jgi:hypothetical protein
MNEIKIITRKIDSVKFVGVREKRNITKDGEDFCHFITAFKNEFNLDDLSFSQEIYNNKGFGFNSRLRTKFLGFLGGQYFLKQENAWQRFLKLVDVANHENKIVKISSLHVAIDFVMENEELITPFVPDSQKYFGKISKNSVLMPKTYRAKQGEFFLSQWTQYNSVLSVVFYNKSEEISSELIDLYPEIYRADRVLRFEIRIKNPLLNFNKTEEEVVNDFLTHFKKKYPFSKKNKLIEQLLETK